MTKFTFGSGTHDFTGLLAQLSSPNGNSGFVFGISLEKEFNAIVKNKGGSVTVREVHIESMTPRQIGILKFMEGLKLIMSIPNCDFTENYNYIKENIDVIEVKYLITDFVRKYEDRNDKTLEAVISK